MRGYSVRELGRRRGGKCRVVGSERRRWRRSI